MDSGPQSAQENTSQETSPKPPSQSSSAEAIKRLTYPTAAGGSMTIDISGGAGALKLDHFGPMVVGQDGTLSRISNWDGMTEMEKKNTLRVLGKRNKERLEALRAQEAKEGEQI